MPTTDRYVSRGVLRERFDLSDHTLTRLLRTNTVRQGSTPGGDARYSERDVEAAMGIVTR